MESIAVKCTIEAAFVAALHTEWMAPSASQTDRHASIATDTTLPLHSVIIEHMRRIVGIRKVYAQHNHSR